MEFTRTETLTGVPPAEEENYNINDIYTEVMLGLYPIDQGVDEDFFDTLTADPGTIRVGLLYNEPVYSTPSGSGTSVEWTGTGLRDNEDLGKKESLAIHYDGKEQICEPHE